tara:strand:- start:204 stop:470 length:267 start_codon:yes stop_codon:yes gene_type:complete
MSKINRKNKKLKKYTVKVYVEKMFQADFYAEDEEQALRMAARSKESEWKDVGGKDDGNMLYKNEWSVVNGDLFGIGNDADFFDIKEDL